MDRWTTFLILLVAVPIQYFIVGFSLPKFLINITSTLLPLGSSDTWFVSWLAGVIWMTEALFSIDSLTLGEVLVYAPRDMDGNVAIQSDRPEGLLYQIGDVLEHKTEGIRGAVISWSVESSESEEEYVLVYIYTVLLDIPDGETPADENDDSSTAQLFQHEVNQVFGQMTSNPELHIFFEAFDGKRFWPKQWLRRVFPNG
ncbi:hypothetical protein WDU94_004374 [Cyamophila willieti]